MHEGIGSAIATMAEHQNALQTGGRRLPIGQLGLTPVGPLWSGPEF
jgi:hypothetical protein